MKNNLFRIVSFVLSFSIVLSLTGCKIVYKYDEKEISKIYYDEVTVDDENGMSNGNPSAENAGNGGENNTNGNNGNGNTNTNNNTNTDTGNNNNNSGTGNNNNTVNNNAGNNNTATGNSTTGNSNNNNNNNNNNTGNGNTSGNSQNASNNQKEFKEKKLSGSLKIQVFINEAQNPSDAWTTVADRFEDATGINVTLIMGSQVNTQYSARWLAGEAPADIVWINGNGLPDEQMAKSGVFYDLTDTVNNGNIYGSSAKIKDYINLNVIEKENGKIFRAPLMTSVQGLWYNKNVIKTAPVNYEQFKSVSKQQKSGLTYPGQYADYSTWGLFMPAVAAYGQDFFNQVASGKPSAFKDSRFKAVMKKYKDYCDSGLVLTGSSSADHMTSQHNWLDGKCGFITNGLWLESEMHDYIPSNFHMAFMASPFIEKNQKPTLVCTSANLAVASKAKNLENALAFIRFVYRDDIQLAFMGKYSYASALKTVDFSKADMSKIARETLNYIYSNQVNLVYKGVRWNDLINNEFKNVINDMTNGSLSVDKACEKLYNTAKKSS